MSQYLNHELGFDEVRWATMRKTSYDVKKSFEKVPEKIVLHEGTLLYRLIQFPTGKYFDAVWWMPKVVFDRIRNDTNRNPKGDGQVFREIAGRLLALPSASTQLGAVEIELVRPVYVWSGGAFGLFDNDGGVPQIYLPHLALPGDPQFSLHARVVRTYWLRFEKW